jgi:histidinol phosphatase-like PHP family hydrolase
MRCDYHIHTHYLGCGNATMIVNDIVSESVRRGVESIAITDHLNDLKFLEKHPPIKRDIEALDAPIDVYFGTELNFLPDGSFPYSEQVAADTGFQFAIGGPHGPYITEYDEEKMVKRQHDRHIATCEYPLIDVLVHPWWFGKGHFDNLGFPWFDDMSVVPRSMTKELGAAARETGTAIEINACAMFANPNYPFSFKAQYVEYLALLAEQGPMFSLCTDAHDITHLGALPMAEAAVREAGIPQDRIWHPPMEPLYAGRGR